MKNGKGSRRPATRRDAGRVRDGRALALILAAWLAAIACSGRVATYGTIDPGTETMPIGDLLDAPELHLGSEVRVAGLVVEVCQEMGCWFEVMEDDRRLLVDLKMGRDFTIPEASAGRWAVVCGTFVREEGALKIIGKGVELRDTPGAQPAG